MDGKPKRIILSQGETRPGLVQDQHWGEPYRPPPTYGVTMEEAIAALRPFLGREPTDGTRVGR